MVGDVGGGQVEVGFSTIFSKDVVQQSGREDGIAFVILQYLVFDFAIRPSADIEFSTESLENG